MREPALIAALAATLTLSVAACKPKAAADGTEKAKETPTQTVAAEEPKRDEPDSPPEPECRDDRQCDGYFRCEEGSCVVPPAVDGRVADGMPTAIFEKDGEAIAMFKVEIADDPWEMSRGLMFRRKMDPSFGMLFVYDDERVRSFWMKNTYLSLDMVHADASGKVVGVVANAEPLTRSPRRTGEPARYVLEIVAGKAEDLGIAKGAQMRLTNVPDELAPR